MKQIEFRLRIINDNVKFRVEVWHEERLIETAGWDGGEFNYLGHNYALRGPYHGFDTYHVFELISVKVEVKNA